MFMKKLICVLLSWSLVLTPIIAQTTTETQPLKPLHTISMGVGMSHTALKFETVSPLIVCQINCGTFYDDCGFIQIHPRKNGD